MSVTESLKCPDLARLPHLIIRLFSGCLNLSRALGTREMIKADEIEAASDKKRVMRPGPGQHESGELHQHPLLARV